MTGTVPGGGLKVEFAFTAPDSPGYFNGEIQLHTNVAVEPITTLPYSALVRNHIRNMRLKLEKDPTRPHIIQSRHKFGYSVRARVEIVAPTNTRIYR